MDAPWMQFELAQLRKNFPEKSFAHQQVMIFAMIFQFTHLISI